MALTAASTLLGCAFVKLQPGTGDIAFRLLWTGTADLDLYVQDPAGQRLSFANRRSDSGGVLDIDCNAGPKQLCRRPIENVYWPQGNAPPGRYLYSVHFLQAHDGKDIVHFEVQVLLGDTVVESRSEALAVDQEAGPYEFVYPERE
jgi:uncharacterized protein YfaP (DUF2135 family)